MKKFVTLLASTALAGAFSQATSAQSTNFVTNGSFEGTNGLTGWQIGGTAGDGLLPVAIAYNQSSQYPTGAQGEAVPPDNASSISPDVAGSNAVYFVSDHANNLSVSQVVYLKPGTYQIGFDTYDTYNGQAEANDANLTALIAGVQLANYNLSSVAPGIWSTHSGEALIQVAGNYLVSFAFNTDTFPAKDVLIDKVYVVGVDGGGGIPIPYLSRLYWDGDATGNAGNGIVDGGNGIWTTVSTNFTDPTGASTGAYFPQPDSVFFTGAPGSVTVDNSVGTVAVTGATFLVSGYHIGGAPLTLSGPNATFSVGDGTASGAAYVATIDAQLIGAAGLTKADLGTLVLTNANSYAGGTTVLAGTLVGAANSFGSGAITDNATLVVNQATNASLSNVISGTGALVKIGNGTLQVTATHTFSGLTDIQAGTLQVDGAMAFSPLFVEQGATLSGTGTAGNIIARAGAVVAPGPGVGQLTDVGNYSQAAGSIYAVDVASGGTSDRITVGGVATLSAGALINVTKTDAGAYTYGTKYKVLTAQEGVTGTYAVTGDTHVSRFLDLVATYDQNDVYLTVSQTSPFASAAATANQANAARGADTGNGQLFLSIAQLQTTADARQAFDAISGEIHATLRGASFEDSRFIREAMIDRLLDRNVSTPTVWLRPFASWAGFNGNGNAATATRNILGFLLGAELYHSGPITLGITGGYDRSSLDLPARSSHANADDAQAGAYAGYHQGALSARLGAGYTSRSITTNRTVTFTGYNDRLTADYNIRLAQAFGEVGYELQGPGLTVEPYANLTYLNVREGQAAESGGAAALTLPSGTQQFVQTTLGARLATSLVLGRTPLSLGATAGWRHVEGDDLSNGATASFVNAPGFEVDGPPIARDAALVEAKIAAGIGDNLSVDISYSGVIGNNFADHGVKATLRRSF